MMDLYTALRKVADGEAITRVGWDDPQAYCELNEGVLIIYTPDTGVSAWQLSIDDFLADDWIIYGEEN